MEAVSITGSQFSDFLSGSSNADLLFGDGGFDYDDYHFESSWLNTGII